MDKEMYRYWFRKGVPLGVVKDALMRATLATECLEGRARVRLNASFRLDESTRTCVVDASTEVGQKIGQVFAGFLTHELGESAFRVERINGKTRPDIEEGGRGA